MLYGHGDNSYQYDGQVKFDFSTNIPGFADLRGLKQHLSTRLSVIGSYPEPEARQLEQLIAQEEGITPQQVMVTAGATEAIYLVAQLYSGWASVIPQPTFSEYEDACKMHGHVVSYYDNDDMEHLPENRLYWLCNPNNPTGKVMLKELVSYVIRQHRQYTFVIDQSYEDYTDKPLLRASQMQDCHNTILLHSMTKRYCIPGLRLGYITSSPIIIDQLRLLRQPWTVNALAIEAGKYLIGQHVNVLPKRQAYLQEARRLHTELNKLDGLMLMDTNTNFMLAYLQNATARDLQSWLLNHYGILIRDASNFHGLDSHCFRVAAHTREADDLLIQAIAVFLSEN
jgi:threonine-phosphate decarboxylase